MKMVIAVLFCNLLLTFNSINSWAVDEVNSKKTEANDVKQDAPAAVKEEPRKLPITFNVTVDFVLDGDSVRVWLTEENVLFLISIYGIDSPELPQPYGEKAKKFVEDALKNKKDIKVTMVKVGEYQTGLGYLIVGGKDIGTALVENGFAEVDEKSVRGFDDPEEKKRMLEIESKAKKQKLGMWTQGEKYESPIDFLIRTQKKKPGVGGKH
jgi:endonuclease YncB( thermonuclease family)